MSQSEFGLPHGWIASSHESDSAPDETRDEKAHDDGKDPQLQGRAPDHRAPRSRRGDEPVAARRVRTSSFGLLPGKAQARDRVGAPATRQLPGRTTVTAGAAGTGGQRERIGMVRMAPE